jgi:apolipoprotein N-acyltransferase|tara:strand:- start:443 stop:2002 length:1560 start_codon:yes stop_codon:yes gene_type:complete
MFKKAFNNRVVIIFIVPFFLGCLSVFSFQPFNYIFLNFIILPIIFLLLSYVNKRSKNIYRKKPYLINLFLIGYSFGIGFFLAGTHWISYSLTFEDSFKYLIPFSIVLIPMFLGLFYGLATLLSGSFLKNNISSVLIFSASFGFCDFLRSKLLSGFPWNLWAYSWSAFPEAIQILNVVGFFSFNLIVVTVFCIPLLLVFKNNSRNQVAFILGIIFLFFNYIYGSIVINQNEINLNILKKNEDKIINVKIISPNFSLKYNLSIYEFENALEKLLKYSEPNPDKETVFVWPEGVFTGYNFSDLVKFKDLFQKTFTNKHKIIFGINTSSKEKNKNFNSLLLVNRDLEILHKYNKRKLVPFGEFLPLENFLNHYGLKKITHGFESFSKGKLNNYIELKNFKILPLICYEIIFPELLQKSSPSSDLIINISEDAWFGNSIGPYQHFAKAIFRAVENNTYLARSANKGISAVVNNKGQIIKSLRPNEAGSIEVNIPQIDNKKSSKNDLIFFTLLFTYTLIFFYIKK